MGAYETLNIEALVLLWPAIWLLDGVFAPLIPKDWQSQLEDVGTIDIEGNVVGRSFVEELFADSDREEALRKVMAAGLSFARALIRIIAGRNVGQ